MFLKNIFLFIVMFLIRIKILIFKKLIINLGFLQTIQVIKIEIIVLLFFLIIIKITVMVLMAAAAV